MKKVLFVFGLVVSYLAIHAQNDSLQQFVGTYKFPDGSVVSSVAVSMEDSTLKMSSEAGNSSLSRLGIDSFVIDRFNGTAIFKRDNDRKVNGVHIEAMGYVLDGEKLPDNKWEFTEIRLLSVLDQKQMYQNLY